MTVAFCLFTDLNHDLVTNLASSFGAIATIGTFIGLYKNKLFGLFAFGLLNILLVGLNNLYYYNKELFVCLFTCNSKNKFCDIFSLDLLHKHKSVS